LHYFSKRIFVLVKYFLQDSFVIVSDTDTIKTEDLSLPAGTSDYLTKNESKSTDIDTEAFGIVDKKAIVEQRIALKKFERKQIKTMKRTGKHQRIQQAKEELQLVNAGFLDSFMLDSKKQRKIYEDAISEKRNISEKRKQGI